jgi:mRNA interferase MazF
LKVAKRAVAPPGWFPKRGEVCLFDLDKKRPAIIISSNALNRHALDVCIVPISSVEHKNFTLRPLLRAGEGGLARESWAKCDQVSTVGKARAEYPPLGALTAVSLERIGRAIKLALELS